MHRGHRKIAAKSPDSVTTSSPSAMRAEMLTVGRAAVNTFAMTPASRAQKVHRA
jgi:hypothetical protein